MSLVIKNIASQAKALLGALVKQVDSLFSSKVTVVRTSLFEVIKDCVYNSSEMESVRSGQLRLDFGLTQDPTESISIAVAKSVDVTVKKSYLSGRKIAGGLEVKIQPADYLNILTIPEAVNIIEDGKALPWLSWLTSYGNQIIIVDFGVEYVQGKGRTGGAIMTTDARPFRVDPSFSGVPYDNFITRSILLNIDKIQNVIKDSIK